MKSILINSALVGSGGFLGALCRYGLSGLVHRQFPLATFPYGTMVVNLVGCLLIGAFAGLVESRQLFGADFRTFAMIGLLGGFTTFSSFGYETLAMLRGDDFIRAAVNVGVQVIFGLGLVWAGYALASSR